MEMYISMMWMSITVKLLHIFSTILLLLFLLFVSWLVTKINGIMDSRIFVQDFKAINLFSFTLSLIHNAHFLQKKHTSLSSVIITIFICFKSTNTITFFLFHYHLFLMSAFQQIYLNFISFFFTFIEWKTMFTQHIENKTM